MLCMRCEMHRELILIHIHRERARERTSSAKPLLDPNRLVRVGIIPISIGGNGIRIRLPLMLEFYSLLHHSTLAVERALFELDNEVIDI